MDSIIRLIVTNRSLSLLFLLITAAYQIEDWRSGRPGAKNPVEQGGVGLVESKTTTQIGEAFAGLRVDKLEYDPDDPLLAGMSGYLLPFVIVSVHLLVVLVGAAYMARPKKRTTSTGSMV